MSIIFGVKRFHQYLYGRQFIIHSDHKPLMYIFDESKAVPLMASARIQRWALTLSAYTYTIQYKAGKDHANADGLIRLPLEDAQLKCQDQLRQFSLWIILQLHQCRLATSDNRQTMTLPCQRLGVSSSIVGLMYYQIPVTCNHTIAGDLT